VKETEPVSDASLFENPGIMGNARIISLKISYAPLS
jgi:hypothetical protein